MSRAGRVLRNLEIMVGILAGTVFVAWQLSHIFDDNNPFAVPVFILAVALVSRFTTGYIYGVLASVMGVLLVNYMFTYPFYQFNITITGYPLTFAVMLLVSLIISALTTQIKKQEQLRFEAEREKMRANLLRSVSHDIRTPLATILGASSALMENEGMSQQDQRELLAEIRKDAKWLTRLTENILSVTKFSADGVILKKTEEVLEEIVGSSIVKFRKNSETIPIHVEKPSEILLVPMDATLIEQVLINLFENVVMHAETATKIEVFIEHFEKKVSISVSDDGVGIAKNILPHVFDGYVGIGFTEHSDDRRNMGIGLSVCYSIIRAHGGGMEAFNNEQGGATFRFWLPMEEEAA